MSTVFLAIARRQQRRQPLFFVVSHTRAMTTSKRVQDRSKAKRVHDLEIVVEKHKIFSKIMFLFETLKSQPEMIIPVKHLDRQRKQLNLRKPHRVSDFIQKNPKLFELYKDRNGLLWCGLTSAAEDLLAEQERLIEAHSDKAAEFVTRFLMMSVDKRIAVDKIAHFRRDIGLPIDFRTSWVHRYPELFRLVKCENEDGEEEQEYLELVNWNPAWAVTELEKKVLGEDVIDRNSYMPETLSLAFPLKFPKEYKKVYRYGGKIEHFQKREYLSPYADARGLKAGSLEFDKRAVAVMHELLSFTVEKRLVTDHLTHFRREFVMPQKLMRLLLKHFGIFYVSERGKRFSVFLNEAYESSELIEKGPLVLWKEKVQSLIGYRGRKKKIEAFSDLSDLEDNNFFESDSEAETIAADIAHDESMDDLEETSLVENTEMDIAELFNEYRDTANPKIPGY